MKHVIDVKAIYGELAKLDKLDDYVKEAVRLVSEGDQDKELVLTGQGPIWLYMKLAVALKDKVKSLSYESPTTGEVLIYSQKPVEEKKEARMVVWSHPCAFSSAHHQRKYSHWAKLVTGVDITKTNGYAYQGGFLKTNGENKVAEGSIIVYFKGCQGKVKAVRIYADRKEVIGEADWNFQSDLIEKVNEELKGEER